MAASNSFDRRRFVQTLGGSVAALWSGKAAPDVVAAAVDPTDPRDRLRQAAAEQIRFDAARLARRRPPALHPTNGDELLYANRIASYTKGLPHNALGEVDTAAYQALLTALQSGDPQSFEVIPLGSSRRFVNPQAGLAFDLEGADSHHLSMPPPPALSGAEEAAELIELYWMALARDVSFAEYAADPITNDAAADLGAQPAFRGPRSGGQVTAATLFRGGTPGDLIGPYLSQFLWRDIPLGAIPVTQRMQTVLSGVDYVTAYSEWLDVQNGAVRTAIALDPQPRYIRSLRDLAQWVHVDALYQAYLQACLILLGIGAPLDPGNPYAQSICQEGFGTFGAPHILSLLTEVATRALKAVWYQKWFVHRRARPEAVGGLVHLTRMNLASYPVHANLLNASVGETVLARHGSYLLPMAFAEGSPLHPSYGAGHATVGGACVTVLKAWFDESFILPDPVIADADGLALLPYTGPALTVGHELDKLAANVAIGRNAAGIHYRSDYRESLRLGEAVALTILEEQKATYNEGGSFSLTTFDGSPIEV